MFLKEFVLFSEKRCQIILNALTKVVYSILRARYGVNLKKKAKVKPKKASNVKLKKKKHVSDLSESESEFSESEIPFLSDDSEFED